MAEESIVRTSHKFVVVLKKSLETGAALNACSHMVATLVARADESLRAEMSFIDYEDADGNLHPVSGLSLIVLSAKNGDHIRNARLAAVEAEIHVVDFTESMTKDTYVEQMERTSALREGELEYWGIAMFGPRGEIDPITRKFSLWR